MKKDITDTLFENVIDSLANGLICYQKALDGEEKQYKYAILSLASYIELSFKFFIAKIHPALIYKTIYTEKCKFNKTIGFDESVNLLENLKDSSADSDERKDFMKNLEFLRKTSNEIKHHTLEFDTEEFKRTIGKILNTLNKLFEEHNIYICDKLFKTDPLIKSIRHFYDKIIDEYEYELLQAMSTAKKRSKQFMVDKDLEAYGDDNRLDCPSCLNYTFVFNKDTNQYDCTYCEKTDEAVECEYCHKTFPQEESHENIIGAQKNAQMVLARREDAFKITKSSIDHFLAG